jgi:hypothetical protein
MDLNEFETDKTIDPLQLDVEACQQPDLFFKWARQSVAARGEVDRTKLAVDVAEARAEAAIRDNPEKYGLMKVTEAAISAAVKIHPKCIEAQDHYLRAREVAGLLDAAREAMEQKKRMIEILVTLHGQQYFAGPSIPRDLAAIWSSRAEATTQAVNDKQRQLARKRVRKEK